MAQLQHQVQQAATKADVVSKREMDSLKADVAKLKGHTSEGGQMLMNREELGQSAEVMASQQDKSEKRLAHMASHVGVVTEETMRLQAKISEFEQLLVAAKLLPQQSVFTHSVAPQDNAANDSSSQLSQTEESLLNDAKRALFTKQSTTF